MADTLVLICDPTKKLKAFNIRMREECEETDWTSAQLHVVDGQPMVILSSEVDIATEEDVAVGITDKVGEEIPAGPPIRCAVSRVSAERGHNCERTEEICEKICDAAGDGMIEEQVAVVQGDTFKWIEHPATGEQVYVPVKSTYVLFVWARDVDEVDEDDDEGEGEEAPDSEEKTIDAEAEVVSERKPRPRRRGEDVDEEDEEGDEGDD